LTGAPVVLASHGRGLPFEGVQWQTVQHSWALCSTASSTSTTGDPLGYHIASWGYSQLQLLQQAVTATKSLDDDKLADYIRKSTLKTLIGDVRFGAQGEWADSRVLELQFQHIKGNDLGQFKDVSTQLVITPAQHKTGDLIYPYASAK
jgi:branched-chain amino acid transport system substrate-binding protein